jgi:hypothetical protein
MRCVKICSFVVLTFGNLWSFSTASEVVVALTVDRIFNDWKNGCGIISTDAIENTTGCSQTRNGIILIDRTWPITTILFATVKSCFYTSKLLVFQAEVQEVQLSLVGIGNCAVCTLLHARNMKEQIKLKQPRFHSTDPPSSTEQWYDDRIYGSLDPINTKS